MVPLITPTPSAAIFACKPVAEPVYRAVAPLSRFTSTPRYAGNEPVYSTSNVQRTLSAEPEPYAVEESPGANSVTLQVVLVEPRPTATVPAVNASAVLDRESLNSAVVPHAAKPRAPTIMMALRRYRGPYLPCFFSRAFISSSPLLLWLLLNLACLHTRNSPQQSRCPFREQHGQSHRQNETWITEAEHQSAQPRHDARDRPHHLITRHQRQVRRGIGITLGDVFNWRSFRSSNFHHPVGHVHGRRLSRLKSDDVSHARARVLRVHHHHISRIDAWGHRSRGDDEHLQPECTRPTRLRSCGQNEKNCSKRNEQSRRTEDDPTQSEQNFVGVHARHGKCTFQQSCAN